MSTRNSELGTRNSLRGRRVLVMGLGRFGGGVGVSRWLAEQGAVVTVTDMAGRDDLATSITALGELPITLHLGGHDNLDLAACELLVVNPAVDKSKSAFFAEALRRGVPWTSENNLFLERCPGTLIGITGSVGKSTTTAMLGEALQAAMRTQPADRPPPTPPLQGGEIIAAPLQGGEKRRVWVGGNIGKSLLSSLSEMTPRDVIVLELSSFQLEDAGVVGRGPNIALLTNLRPNHLDRHGTMDAYAAAKRNIFAFQRAGDVAITPAGDELCGYRFTPPPDVRTVWFDVDESRRPRWGANTVETIRTLDVSLAVPGLHNRLNAAAALAACDAMGVSLEAARPGLEAFAGLPHRLEFVREVGGVRYYNDSKATTPDAAITALLAFEQPVVLLCGGYDKGLPFEKLAAVVSERARAVVCHGATREAIRTAVEQARGPRAAPSVDCVNDLRSGVELSRRLAQRGDVVVLAPGCASYDMFKNYEERGEAFKRIVQSWA